MRYHYSWKQPLRTTWILSPNQKNTCGKLQECRKEMRKSEQSLPTFPCFVFCSLVELNSKILPLSCEVHERQRRLKTFTFQFLYLAFLPPSGFLLSIKLTLSFLYSSCMWTDGLNWSCMWIDYLNWFCHRKVKFFLQPILSEQDCKMQAPLLSGESQPNTNKAFDFSVPALMNKACKIQPVHSKLLLFLCHSHQGLISMGGFCEAVTLLPFHSPAVAMISRMQKDFFSLYCPL